MNELLNIKLRHKESGELFLLTGFHSASRKNEMGNVTEIGLRRCENIKESFGISGAQLNDYELFMSITDF